MMNLEADKPLISLDPFTGKLNGDMTRYSFSLVLNPEFKDIFDKLKGHQVVVEVSQQVWDLEEPKVENQDLGSVSETEKVPGIVVGFDGANIYFDNLTTQNIEPIPFYLRNIAVGDYGNSTRIKAIRVPDQEKELLEPIWKTKALSPQEQNTIITNVQTHIEPGDRDPREVMADRQVPENDYLWQLAHWYDLTESIIQQRIERIAQETIAEFDKIDII